MVDLATAAWDRLSAYPSFQDFVLSGLIGTDAEADAPDEEKLEKAWIFQGLDKDGRPFRNAEGSGTSVVVLSSRDDWAAANRHNTWTFPALQMLVYTDSDRNSDGSLVTRNAVSKCKEIMRALNRCFHLVGNTEEDQAWPGLRVHSCLQAGGGLRITDVPDAEDGATVRGEYRYEVVTD